MVVAPKSLRVDRVAVLKSEKAQVLMRWFTRRSRHNQAGEGAQFNAPLLPDRPFCAVGDIHGRMDLLAEVLAGITRRWPDAPVVFVGDYIDRGPDSAEVLRHLFSLQTLDPFRITCLLGNHEDMLLSFLDSPERTHRVWLRNGGDATLQSFGVSLPTKTPTIVEVGEIRDGLQQAMGADLVAWLRECPLAWRTGNVWVTHAGSDPFVDMDRQDRTALLWGHPDFRKLKRADAQWVVHGHTIVHEVHSQDGRIAIDTGAYYTGRLSVVHVSNDGIVVLD